MRQLARVHYREAGPLRRRQAKVPGEPQRDVIHTMSKCDSKSLGPRECEGLFWLTRDNCSLHETGLSAQRRQAYRTRRHTYYICHTDRRVLSGCTRRLPAFRIPQESVKLCHSHGCKQGPGAPRPTKDACWLTDVRHLGFRQFELTPHLLGDIALADSEGSPLGQDTR